MYLSKIRLLPALRKLKYCEKLELKELRLQDQFGELTLNYSSPRSFFKKSVLLKLLYFYLLIKVFHGKHFGYVKIYLKELRKPNFLNSTMNTFPFNLPNTKPISRTSSKDAINPVVNIFSPEQSSDIEITTSWVEEKSSNISEWPATSLIQERPKVPTPQQESQPKFSEAETHHQSPYFTDQLKIKDSKAADKLVNQEENHSSVTNLEQNIGTSDHSSIGSRNIGGCRKPREVGTYDAHLVEKEFENLVHQLNLKRQHDAKTFQHFSESLRMKVPSNYLSIFEC